LIDHLTKEQENKLTEYRDKWLEIGLSTKPADRQTAEKGILKAYQIAGIKTIPKIVWCDSPLSNCLTSVRFPVKSVMDSVETSVRNSVVDSVRTSMEDSVADSVRTSVTDSVWDTIYGQHDAAWLGYYDYYADVLKLNRQTEKLEGLWMIAKSAGWFVPCDNICWISERHNVCKLKDGKIHSDGSPAIQYPDGFSVWGLNGVRVSREIAETPFDKLDAKLILKEKNAEVRREIVRKIGVEKLCKDLNAKCIDKVDNYELLLLKMEGERNRYYLKMINPSIGCYHIEGVHPDCDTVEKALNWRNGTSEKPVVLT